MRPCGAFSQSAGVDPENAHRAHKVERLLLQALGGGRAFLDQRCVLLRGRVHLADRLGDLRDAEALLVSVITQFDVPMIAFSDGLRSHHGA